MGSVPTVNLPRSSPPGARPRYLRPALGVLILFFGLIWGYHRFTPAPAPPPPSTVAAPTDASPLQRAEMEARSFLYPCPAEPQICPSQQERFVDSYILSSAGQTYFMGDVIGFLDPLHSAEPGIRVDRIKACAWRFVRFKLTAAPAIASTYDRDWTASCVNRKDLDVAAQKAAILALVSRLTSGEVTISPRLAALRDRYAPLEPVTAAIIDRAASQGLLDYR